ncbi:hypothetical protein MUA17_12065 [Staphylococcus felis]|nr:hypothetical protein MUA17_12065 [Staphylococcus felis]
MRDGMNQNPNETRDDLLNR